MSPKNKLKLNHRNFIFIYISSRELKPQTSCYFFVEKETGGIIAILGLLFSTRDLRFKLA